jgi:hypothetical protein
MEKVDASSQPPGRIFPRLAIVLAGIVLGQFLLYGPSLMGRKVLLPLNCLAMRELLPAGHGCRRRMPIRIPRPQDLVLVFEPDRRFRHKRVRRGPFSIMDTGQVWRGSVSLAQVLAFLSVHLSGGITRHPRVGATPRRAGCGHGGLFILPARASGKFLAGDPRRLVLSHDRLFYFLARLPHLRPGLLAALVAVRR